MNESLKIIITAAVNDAKKGLQEVRKELEEIEKAAQEASKPVDVAMQAIGKGAMIAVAGVTALTTALVALGRSSLEFQKIQGQLNAGFQAMGLSAEQAGATYKELFGFLGEADTAAETANLLARLTQEEENLAEWTQILQGVFATFPSSLPIESLAESINHTAQMAQVEGNLADALEWAGMSVDAFNAKLATTNSVSEREALIRSTLNSLYGQASVLYGQANQALIAYNQSQVELDYALATATAYVVPLMTALNNLAATLLSVLRPAFTNISAVIVAFVQWVIAAIKAVGAFFGVFGSKGTTSTRTVATTLSGVSTNAGKVASGVNKVGKAFDNATKSAEKLRRQTMGFDELNIIQPQQTASASGGGGAGSVGGGGGGVDLGGIDDVFIPGAGISGIDVPGLAEFEEKVARIQQYLTPIMTLVGLIGAGLVVWKIADFLMEMRDLNEFIKLGNTLLTRVGKEGFEAAFGEGSAAKIGTAKDRIGDMQRQLKTLGGTLLIVAGAFLTIYGYSNAWVNGVKWGNLAVTLAGLAAIIGGLYLAFGPLAASIGAVVAGVALLVLGVKDFIANGPTMQNTILIIGGAIAIAVGLATSGVSVLISVIIAAVAAIGAFVAAILLEEPAIKSVEDAQNALNEAKERAAQAENNYINAVDAAEASLDRLTAAEKAAGMSGKDLFEQVQSGSKDYADLTAEQKELYKAYIDNEQKQEDLEASTKELRDAKKAETLASYENQLALAKESGNYDDFKKSVVDAYKSGQLSADEARTLIEKSMSEMSDASQQTFMKDLPGDIKNGMDPSRYESTGTKIKKWFQNLWKSIKDFFGDAKTFFADVGKKIGDAISGAVKGAVNAILKSIVNKINGFISAINTAIGIINAIPGVNINKLSKLQVPQLAKGGIVDSATLAVIGERGKEAVLPLENNTGWMDALAEKISTKNGTPSRIVLMLDGRELGHATINSINDITRQTGQLQLALV